MSSGPGPSGKRRRAAEEEHEGGHENAERWLLSYADMITLLMALFVVLFAISQVDQKKLFQLTSGLNQYFGTPVATSQSTGILSGSDTATSFGSIAPLLSNVTSTSNGSGNRAVTKGGSPSTDARAQLQQVQKSLTAALTSAGLAASVEFQMRKDGLVVNIVSDRVLFDPGDATLRTGGTQVLTTLAPTLSRLPNELTVEGHTDDVPVSGRYPSNWELSTARATTVLRFLLSRGVQGSQISASGYADTRPLATNATDLGRAKNRRVALVIHVSVDSSSATTSANGVAP